MNAASVETGVHSLLKQRGWRQVDVHVSITDDTLSVQAILDGRVAKIATVLRLFSGSPPRPGGPTDRRRTKRQARFLAQGIDVLARRQA